MVISSTEGERFSNEEPKFSRTSLLGDTVTKPNKLLPSLTIRMKFAPLVVTVDPALTTDDSGAWVSPFENFNLVTFLTEEPALATRAYHRPASLYMAKPCDPEIPDALPTLVIVGDEERSAPKSSRNRPPVWFAFVTKP